MKISIEGDYGQYFIKDLGDDLTWSSIIEETKYLLRGLGYVIPYDFTLKAEEDE